MPYAIMRFKKTASGGIVPAQHHNEREKKAYKSNPDIDLSRIANDYHVIKPDKPYKTFINSRIHGAGCRTRKDSVLMVETVLTATPEFLNNLPPEKQREFFHHAVLFFEREIGRENIVSAIVHMDEKTPHMHLCFVPLTKDNRLSAKEIIGNREKLCKWQDKYHEHMAEKFPALQRGLSAVETKRKHIPTWMLKKASGIENEGQRILELFESMNRLNTPKVKDELLTRFPAWMKKVDVLSAQIRKSNLDLEQWKSKAKEAKDESKYYQEQTEALREKFKRMHGQLSAMQDFKKYMTPERREEFMKLMKESLRNGYLR